MVKIKSHCQNGLRGEYTPLAGWPEDCVVQWGGNGIVLGAEPRTTAFFEAFPSEGGFFRGEGTTIAEADADALEKYKRFAVCDHQWSRGRNKKTGETAYTNGGAICRKCKAFYMFFKPITRFGRYKDPLESYELEMAADGGLIPDPRIERRDPRQVKYRRRIELRLRLNGIDLPQVPEGKLPLHPFKPDMSDPYLQACRLAVANWYREHRDQVKAPGSPTLSMGGLFNTFSVRYLEDLLEEVDGTLKADELS